LKQSELASVQFRTQQRWVRWQHMFSGSSAPSGLAALAASSSQVNLTWNAVAPPSGCSINYSVFRSTTSGFTPSSSNQIASGLTTTSFANTGLAAATYYYKVEAVDATGPSPASTQASATTQQSSSGDSRATWHTPSSPMEHRFPGGGNHREHRTVGITSWTLKWTSLAISNHQSVERELFAKQGNRDGEQPKLQRDHSARRKIQRAGLYRKLQRDECTTRELLSEWRHLPLVADLAMVPEISVWLIFLCSGRYRLMYAHPEAAFVIPADPT